MNAFSCRTLMALAFITASAGCAYNPPPVAVDGAPPDLEALVGEWNGEYTGGPRTRSGSVTFRLVAREDHAHGDVLMIPEGSTRPYAVHLPGNLPSGTQPFDRIPQVLTIRFVRAVAGGITGAIEAYWDPDRNCQASATFTGRQHADTIEGTFTSACERGDGHTTGQWKVIRKRPTE
jgi:hypothetical protein